MKVVEEAGDGSGSFGLFSSAFPDVPPDAGDGGDGDEHRRQRWDSTPLFRAQGDEGLNELNRNETLCAVSGDQHLGPRVAPHWDDRLRHGALTPQPSSHDALRHRVLDLIDRSPVPLPAAHVRAPQPDRRRCGPRGAAGPGRWPVIPLLLFGAGVVGMVFVVYVRRGKRMDPSVRSSGCSPWASFKVKVYEVRRWREGGLRHRGDDHPVSGGDPRRRRDVQEGGGLDFLHDCCPPSPTSWACLARYCPWHCCPLSGSGAFGITSSLVETHGADSMIGTRP